MHLKYIKAVKLIPLVLLVTGRALLVLIVYQNKQTKTNSMAWVRYRSVPIQRPPLVGEASANFYG
jgi:hypothetical protein